jgi:ATP synthase protein I
MDENIKKAIKTLGILSTVGLAMALSIAIGAYAGYLLDKRFDSSPWLSLVGLGMGIVAAFRNLYVMYKRAKR